MNDDWYLKGVRCTRTQASVFINAVSRDLDVDILHVAWGWFDLQRLHHSVNSVIEREKTM